MSINILLVHHHPPGLHGLAGGLVEEGAVSDAGGAGVDGHGHTLAVTFITHYSPDFGIPDIL